MVRELEAGAGNLPALSVIVATHDRSSLRLLLDGLSIVPNLMRSVWTFGWYSVAGNERKKYRAKGRYYHYGPCCRKKSAAGFRTVI